jgi:AcrR family transcriptional regulator
MTQPPGPTSVSRGRPRNAAVDRAVIDTVLRLVTDGATFGHLSMVGIARAAGVGKATVYRRWPDKEALLLDVLRFVQAPLAEPTGRTLRENLLIVLCWVRQHSLAKRESALIRNLQTQMQSSPELWRHYYEAVIAPRRRVIARVLDRGIAEGEIRAELAGDMDLLVDMVAGPLLTRVSQRPDAPMEEDLIERFVDILLDGMRPRD